MSLLDILWDFFRKPEPVVFIEMPVVNGWEINNVLSQFNTDVKLSDGLYRLMHYKEVVAFLAKNPVSSRKYIIEAHDCDDFSFELMGDVSSWHPDNTFGIVWGLNKAGFGHAWNFFIDGDKKVWFVEPQNDSVFEPSTEKIWFMLV